MNLRNRIEERIAEPSRQAVNIAVMALAISLLTALVVVLVLGRLANGS